jgi:hypothetical protein
VVRGTAGAEDSVWVEYGDPTRLYEMPASQYVLQGCSPPPATLPVYARSDGAG